MRVRRNQIEELVERLLTDNHVSKAPVPVPRIARRLGLKLQLQPFEEEGEMSGILVRDGKDVILGVNASHHLNRRRFTIAHEIGHFLLHEGDRVFVDRSNYKVSLRDALSSSGSNVEEIEANMFASLLLIPERFLMDDLEGKEIDIADDRADHEVRALARKYKVSPQAMAFRLLNRSGIGR